jgi:uncharacterized protein YggE
MTNIKKIFQDWQFAVGAVALSIVFVGLFLSVFLIVKAINVGDENDFPNQITVNGTGEVVAIPDIATFSFTVTETSESVASSQSLATAKINSALTYLKDNGIAENDIKTTGYNVYPKYEWIQGMCNEFSCPPGKQSLVGYEVSQSISVKVRDTEKAGEVLAGIGSFEISNISGLSFTIDDEEKLKDEAREKAIQDAKERAVELSKSLGVELEEIVSFGEENESYYPEYEYYAKSASLGLGGDIAPETPTGENTYTKRVWVTYEIEE